MKGPLVSLWAQIQVAVSIDTKPTVLENLTILENFAFSGYQRKSYFPFVVEKASIIIFPGPLYVK